jgi:sialate O-acetylesterase
MNHVRFFVTALAFATSAHADVKPAALFQDHAVLQRDKPVPVWGTADAGETVSVTFGTQTLSTVAAPDGRWSLTLAPLAANATPATLTLKGKNTIVLQDIVVGEVWLASGQSNMEWSLSRSYDPDLEQLTARFPLVREIKVKRRTASEPMAVGLDAEPASAAAAVPMAIEPAAASAKRTNPGGGVAPARALAA